MPPPTTSDPHPTSHDRASDPASHAELIHNAYRAYRARFQKITRKASRRFAERDWDGIRDDAKERLTVYKEIVDHLEYDLRNRLGERVHDKALWRRLHEAYADLVSTQTDGELAETFFNSVTRRIFDTVGVDPDIEFVTTDLDEPRDPPERPITRVFERLPSTEAYVSAILEAYACSAHDPHTSPAFGEPYAQREEDVRRVAAFIDERLQNGGLTGPIIRVELIRNVFYRGIGAYLVGRLYVETGDTPENGEAQMVPLALCFHNEDGTHEADCPAGVVVDAVLLNEDDISILFSFARSYFHVQAPHPRALVQFLKRILPRKRVAELYIAIGYNKHGKTELYRDLLQHFAQTDDAFVRARGKRGMVMTVFTMESYNMVFKIIRDEFDPPKTTTRKGVKERYHVVFKHDRAGRLVDAQEFEHLRLHRRLFADELLEELLDIAGDTVHLDGDRVVIEHCYVERRVTPLDLYVREEPFEKAKAALIEYGDAIKDLARTNIFPGDLLLKNFGVTRHGRVVFYDYDELGFVTDYQFRQKPQAQTYMDEMSADAWFYVGPDDVFPEEFEVTMGVSDALMEAFKDRHGDLFTAQYWQDVKERIENGTIIPILPYPPRERLPHRREVTPEDLAT
jgi:isocitrate dehydrogenase kinase/phosphatase